MGMMSPVFREVNFARINELKSSGKLSDNTVANIISDETGASITGQDVSGYLKINGLASEKMLVSKDTMKAVNGNDSSGLNPAV